jgi:hypothetical protein
MKAVIFRRHEEYSLNEMREALADADVVLLGAGRLTPTEHTAKSVASMSDIPSVQISGDVKAALADWRQDYQVVVINPRYARVHVQLRSA